MRNRLLQIAALVLVALWSPQLEASTHVVQSGEILGSIAARYGVSVTQLREWNRLSNDTIFPGQELRVGSGAGPSPSTGGGLHVVAPGETLGAIAIRHGVSISDIVGWNRGLNPDRIRVGQELQIRTAGRASRRVTYEIQPGDIVGRVAERHGVSVSDIAQWNPRLNLDQVRVGQEIVLMIRGPEVPSESIGRPNAGRLANGEQLPPHRAITIRNPDRSWGTNFTIGAIHDAFDHMARRYASLPRLRVHDLSLQNGGSINDHVSHESGRDVDMGYYHRGCRAECPYERFRPEDLDFERQWALLSYWIEREMVELIFMDYSYQHALHDWLRDRGASREDLRRWFQYPRGRNSTTGLIRHEPNHADHIHVRFACPPGDRQCR